jgi:hypothetical protein
MTEKDSLIMVEPPVSLDQINSVFQKLAASVNDKNNETDQKMLLLKLKSLHRDLYNSVQIAQSNLEKKTRAAQKKQRRRDALVYEKEHLQQQIDHAKNFKTPHLLQLAQEDANETAAVTDETVLLTNYLGTSAYAIPVHRNAIVSRLHKEINTRGGMERDLKLKQLELAVVQKKLKERQLFLKALPDQLQLMERASMSLQKSFALPLISSERKLRLERAQFLPAPLYTLFHQLQAYIDEGNSKGEDDDDVESKHPKELVSISDNKSGDPNDAHVLLQLPVPDIPVSLGNVGSSASKTKKRVTIQFHCDNNRVAAVATGCSSTLLQDTLLVDLYPNDNPDASHRRRPYAWCNAMAGLHVTSAASTRSILATLRQRVIANATLKRILLSLQKKQIPDCPSLEQDGSLQVAPETFKLTSFESKGGAASVESLETLYSVALRIGTSAYQFHVTIHMARYPAVPPVWSLQRRDDSNNDDGETLYNDHLASLEHLVNIEMLERMLVLAQEKKEKNQALHYEWILVQQLHQILQTLSLEDETTGVRKRKGRDRASVNKKESSPHSSKRTRTS